MSGGIKISPILPIWNIYYINAIDKFLEKKCGSSIDHFIIITIKNTCAEVYIIHWHVLAPFGNNSLVQQLQQKKFAYRSTKWYICNQILVVRQGWFPPLTVTYSDDPYVMHCPYISDTNETQYNTPHKNSFKGGQGILYFCRTKYKKI